MYQRSRVTLVRMAGVCLGPLVLILSMTSASIPAQDSKAKRAARQVSPAASSPDEPIAKTLSMTQAARFLDGMALSWTRQHKCGSCHSNYPYLLARPALSEPSPSALAEVRGFFEHRVAHWNDDDPAAKPRWDAEVISTAAALAFNDAATGGALHPMSRQALDRVWRLQKAGGGFEWLKCAWPPLEYDDYYGAIVVALGVGHAPGGYSQTAPAQAGLARLRDYFTQNAAPNLHHETMLLWAATRLDGLMNQDQKAATIVRLRKLQRSDGGWNLPSLGSWKRRDGAANDPNAPSDGYATGLVVYVLRQAGVPATDPALERAVGWLRAHQRVSGRWFTRSLNNDKEHYISRAGSAYAVLALMACGVTGDADSHR